MRAMSTGYVDGGRTRQKQRTREQLLDAARRLIAGGDIPSVEEAAEEAGVSRTTAYRYFPTQGDLLAAAFPETAATSLLPVPAPEDVGQRVKAVATALIERIEQTEPQQRAMLRLSLGDVPHELPLRQGRAIAWFSEALAPLRERLGDEAVHRLAVALRSVCGIETRVWLRDIAGLDTAEIAALQVWMVEVLAASGGPLAA